MAEKEPCKNGEYESFEYYACPVVLAKITFVYLIIALVSGAVTDQTVTDNVS